MPDGVRFSLGLMGRSFATTANLRITIPSDSRHPSHDSRENFPRRLHVILAPDVERRPLVQLVRHDVEDVRLAVGRRSTSRFNHEGERVRLVEQSQLAARALRVGRVREQPAAEQVAMEVGHE